VSERIYLIRHDLGLKAKYWHIGEGTQWGSSPMNERPLILNDTDAGRAGVLVWCQNPMKDPMVYIAEKMAVSMLKNCKPRKTIARGTYAELWPLLLSHGEML
jgi:hypothetical protein